MWIEIGIAVVVVGVVALFRRKSAEKPSSENTSLRKYDHNGNILSYDKKVNPDKLPNCDILKRTNQGPETQSICTSDIKGKSSDHVGDNRKIPRIILIQNQDNSEVNTKSKAKVRNQNLEGKVPEFEEGNYRMIENQSKIQTDQSKPTSVNYHFTRRCNYKCGFCFHTAKTSFVLPLDKARHGLKLLKNAGMEKVNFSGGEPFLEDKGRFVGELVKYCKEVLCLPSVSIVSNGSLIKQSWFQQYGTYLDILAISCDSFDPETNKLIGRQQGKKCHLESLHNVRQWCSEYRVAFKLNTVVNRFNKDEDMTEQVKELNPCRWKVFQCLLLDGENNGDEALRDANRFLISDEDFQEFLDRHSSLPFLVPESNDKMQNSYLILDEYMRFLDCQQGKKIPSKSILDVGVDHALQYSGFDEAMFLKRGGKYVWSKEDMKLEW